MIFYLTRFKAQMLNEKGFGLVGVVFVVVIGAMFGLLIARNIMTSSVASAEDYLWTQGLYAAESGVQLKILYNDGGGNFGGSFSIPVINDFSLTISDDYSGYGNPATLRVKAARQLIAREIEIKYLL